MPKMMKLTFFALFIPLNPPLFTAFLVSYIVILILSDAQSTLAMSPLTDFLSLSLIILTLWLTIFMISANFFSKNKSGLLSLFKALLVALMMSFFSPSLMMFYFYFEVALIPIFLIILVWGYQAERFTAGLLMLFYTLAASFPLLATLILMWTQGGTFSMCPHIVSAPSISMWVNLAFLGAFLVKFPMFGAHLWLPKAHVEAPVAGSMILAGILLKLGGYGIFRLAFLTPVSSLTPGIMMLSGIGGGLLSILCCRMSDMKVLIAYSSVVHMALIILNLLGGSSLGTVGVWWAMLAHGLVSSGLFAGANILYDRAHSRSMLMNKGGVSKLPSLSIFWFLLTMMNFGGPFTLNLFSEVVLIMNAMSYSWWFAVPVAMLSFFSAAYSIMLYASTQQGKSCGGGQMALELSARELNLMLGHTWPIFTTLLILNI